MRRLALLAAAALLAAGCSSEEQTTQLEVVTAAYPFAWLVEEVGGEDVKVTNLTKPGAEPHEIELSPRQVATVRSAKVVVYLKGFQPAVDDAINGGSQGVDVRPVVDVEKGDPHVWLDPIRMQRAAQVVADRLAKADPERAEEYQARGVDAIAKLTELDRAFRRALKSCERNHIVTSHSAFGYLAARYGLVQHGISGLSPDAEPSPGQLADVTDYAREHGITTIFFESLVDPKVARTVASEVGASTAVLDPIEGVTGRDDYISVQLRNAAALRRALECH